MERRGNSPLDPRPWSLRGWRPFAPAGSFTVGFLLGLVLGLGVPVAALVGVVAGAAASAAVQLRARRVDEPVAVIAKRMQDESLRRLRDRNR